MPILLSALAWLPLGSAQQDGADDAPGSRGLGPLRAQVVSRYRVPFDEILGTPQAREQLAGADPELAMAQLIGPVVFARIAGLPPIGPEGCARIVEDFFTARRASGNGDQAGRSLTTMP